MKALWLIGLFTLMLCSQFTALNTTIQPSQVMQGIEINKCIWQKVKGTGSMMPTISTTSTLCKIKYSNQSLNVGDIIIFKIPDSNSTVVHRIIGFNDYIITKGDNNEVNDKYNTTYSNITYIVGGILYT